MCCHFEMFLLYDSAAFGGTFAYLMHIPDTDFEPLQFWRFDTVYEVFDWTMAIPDLPLSNLAI